MIVRNTTVGGAVGGILLTCLFGGLGILVVAIRTEIGWFMVLPAILVWLLTAVIGYGTVMNLGSSTRLTKGENGLAIEWRVFSRRRKVRVIPPDVKLEVIVDTKTSAGGRNGPTVSHRIALRIDDETVPLTDVHPIGTREAAERLASEVRRTIA
jgi:hypothetical protein